MVNNTNDKELSNIEQATPTEYGLIESFLGKQIVINDSVIEQISVIAQQDDKLSYNDSIIQIYDVKWRINLKTSGIVLFTSVNPDEPQMRPVINYLNGIYGEPYDDDEYFNIKWSSSPNLDSIFSGNHTLIHLRRVRSEREGGTFLMFN